MLLKRLELRGFKSFADSTVFEFDSGVTAIVGANGSGKSNVADAIRWVLGEQSLRVLRSKRTEDIIFAGSSLRKSLGMAEVSLTFDNSDRRFDLPFTEVVLTRRAYRSGENEYLLNRERIRWRDLVDLLQKASISSNGYTVIGQGMVDLALSLKAGERRELLEEAADLKRYRARLAEAREKLAATQQNIVRANDMIAEIAPRLRQLETQAQQLRVHQELSHRLRTLQRQWFANQWKDLCARLAEAARSEELARTQLAALQEEQERHAERLSAIAGEREQLLSTAKAYQEKKSETSAQHEQTQRGIDVQRERCAAAARQLEDLQGELDALGRDRDAEEGRVEDLRRRLSQLAIQEDEAQRQSRELDQRLAECRNKRRTLSAEMEAAQQRAFEIATRGADQRNRLASLRDRRQEIDKEAAKHRALVGEAKRRLADHNSKLQELQARLQTLECESIEMARNRAALTAQAEECRSKQQSTMTRQADLQSQLGQMRVRFDLLSRLHRSRSGYYHGVKAVLDAAGDGRGERLSGIVGVVASLIQVPTHLEIAISTALGSQAQDIVVARWKDAEAAIEFLKRTGAGRATFLPLDTLSPNVRVAGRDNWPPQAESGVVGVASQLVQCEPQLAPVTSYLLGRTLVVDDMATARRILSRCPAGWFIVTLAGELVRPGGAITGGAHDQKGPVGLLARERELRELPKAIESLEASISSQAEILARQRKEESELNSRASRLDGEIAEVQRHIRDATREYDTAVKEVTRLEREITWYQATQERLDAERQALDQREIQALAELTRAEELQRQQAEVITRIREQLAEAELAEQGASTAANDLARVVALRQGETKSAKELLNARLGSLAAIDKQVVLKRQRLAELQETLSSGQRIQAELQAQLAGQADSLRGLEEALRQIEVSQLSLEDQERMARQAHDQVSRQLSEAEIDLRKMALDAARWREEADHLRQQLANEDPEALQTLPDGIPGQLPLPIDDDASDGGSVETVSPEDLKRQIDDLKSRLRSLGVVNPQAIADFEELAGRHKFLVEQALDLNKASTSLQRVITELERAARKRFDETFAAVAREFSKHFVALFGGGSARLLLTSEDDGSEPGIDIVAQPPGKRPQNLSLLSGGERALTAAALIFAVLEVVPTPFSVLDEVDAALDDVNVERFCQTLSTLSRRTQFIVITHNRGTMEAAKTLYGLSMSESNTSRVLSLHMADTPEEVGAADA